MRLIFDLTFIEDEKIDVAKLGGRICLVIPLTSLGIFPSQGSIGIQFLNKILWSLKYGGGIWHLELDERKQKMS